MCLARDFPDPPVLHAVDDMHSSLAQALRETTGRTVAFTNETNIARDLDLDSLAVMNFVMALEDRYDISIPLDRVAEISTIGDLIAVINKLRAGPAA